MLRHIISVSLAMTTCATLVATKANAINFTLTPIDNLQRNSGEGISFVLRVDPQNDGGLNGVKIEYIYQPSIFNSAVGIYDFTELSFVEVFPLINLSQPVTYPRDIAAFVFNVNNPIKDGETDLTGVKVDYRINNVFDSAFVVSNQTLDVQPVPEPLTMLGAAAALGYGAILKRKYSKKIEA
jgi:hypothetical protein